MRRPTAARVYPEVIKSLETVVAGMPTVGTANVSNQHSTRSRLAMQRKRFQMQRRARKSSIHDSPVPTIFLQGDPLTPDKTK
jgi:hypothetical protein